MFSNPRRDAALEKLGFIKINDFVYHLVGLCGVYAALQAQISGRMEIISKYHPHPVYCWEGSLKMQFIAREFLNGWRELDKQEHVKNVMES